MTKEYFEEIEILEGVYLKDKKVLLQRDWSSFFDVKFYIDGKEFYSKNKELLDKIEKKKNNNKKLSENEFKLLKQEYFLNKLSLKLNGKFSNLNDYFEIKNPNENILNNRIYNKKNNLILEYIQKDYFIAYLVDNIDKNNLIKELLYSIDDLQKHFNPKSFFSDHESLLDKNCDFIENKKVFLGLKNDKKEKLNTIEDQINNLNDEQKFYVKVNLKDLDIKNCNFEGKQKYENIFILERGDYIYHTNKK